MKLTFSRSLWISGSYGFCEYNRVVNLKKCKTIISVRSSFQISQMEILLSFNLNVFQF